ncbi:MAG TPA: hypothetical protein VLW06_07325 [Terriglobales bacterium]|nr:hypothetical protein [Terriglobales bacterium]
MKKSVSFLAATIALTLLFYLLAYFFLPPPPPSASMMVLFAGIAAVLVWILRVAFRRVISRKTQHRVLVLVGLMFASAYPIHLTAPLFADTGSNSSLSTICKFQSGPKAGTTYDYASSAAVPVGTPCTDGQGSIGVIISRSSASSGGSGSNGSSGSSSTAASDHSSEPSETMPRVTGIGTLLRNRAEEPGYGLYSYALLKHAPDNDELRKYRSFFTALMALPSATDLARYLPKKRINITYLLLTSVPRDWDQQSSSQRLDYVISHYDYARCAAMLASLPRRTGTGPVIASGLAPMSLDRHPHPVLVQDLSTAQPVLMADYVSTFVALASRERFWQPSMLETFTLELRNFLEVAASGVGMSQDAVQSWVRYFR